ncbi:MAG: hypothetical protein HS126_36890 [Anaerolineales bacterium]|nr:hypothetical protein [Anaerolineales bacterium]
MPIIFIVIFGLIIVGVTIYNEVHRSKYNKLMSHLQQHHVGIYEQIRIKPVFGPFYAKGAYKTSIDYAKNHPPLDDPVAEKLLTDYAEFSQKSIWVVGAIVAIAFAVWIGWRLFSAIG